MNHAREQLGGSSVPYQIEPFKRGGIELRRLKANILGKHVLVSPTEHEGDYTAIIFPDDGKGGPLFGHSLNERTFRLKSFDDAEQLMDIMCRRLKDGIDPSIMFKEEEEADQQSIRSLLDVLTGRKSRQK